MKTVFDREGVTLIEGDAGAFLDGRPGPPFAAVVTDPPYGVGIKGLDGKRWDNGFPHPSFWAKLLGRVGDGGLLATFCASRTVHRSAAALEEGGWAVREIMAWIRPYAIGRRGGLKRGWEAIVLASKGEPRAFDVDRARVRGDGIPAWPSQDLPDKNRALNFQRGNPANRRTTRAPSSAVVAAEDEGLLGDRDRFFIVGRATTREKGDFNTHPSVKPLSLMEHLLALLNADGGLAFDPFAGSGTTLVAARRLGHKCVGVEVEPEYCEIARRRLEEAPLLEGGADAR
jgi:site-specific DNA-methyltransferase (adenine-specific)